MEAALVRVLIADDNYDACNLLAALLLTLPCDVKIAHTGKEAVDVALDFEPELVILDIEMPVMDGCEAVRAMQRQGWATGAIFVAFSGAGGRPIAERIRECGFHHHFVKPTPFAQFEAIIRNMRHTHA